MIFSIPANRMPDFIVSLDEKAEAENQLVQELIFENRKQAELIEKLKSENEEQKVSTEKIVKEKDAITAAYQRVEEELRKSRKDVARHKQTIELLNQNTLS